VKNQLALVLFVELAVAAGAAEQETNFRFRKDVGLDRSIREDIIAVTLDSDVYAGTRDGFPDLRLVDERDAFVPYLLEPIGKPKITQVRETCASKLLSLRVNDGKGLEIVVALEEKAPSAAGLTVQTPLSDYEHRVRVFGSKSGTDWSPLVADGVIFDYSRFMDIRNRDIDLPANDFRQFKLVVEQELEDRESPLRELIRAKEDGKKDTRVEITANLRTPFRIDRVELWRKIDQDMGTETASFPYPPAGFKIEQDAKNKVSTVEIQTRREPLTRLSFASASRNFSRQARVLVPIVRGLQTDWVEIARGTVSSIQFRTFSRTNLHVDFPEQRQDRYRIEIENADNPPLEITSVDSRGTGYRLVFLRSEVHTYRLEYGSETARLPRYDTAEVLASLKRGYSPFSVKLGSQIANPAFRPERSPFAFLNSSFFLTLAIVIMVVVLAWALFRAGERINKAAQEEV
jgi:hypothetical protein